MVAEQELNLLLSGRGFLARIFRPLFRMVSRSWQMFPIGFLFGLGFDTATEISLFTVAASQASGGMSLSTIMIFPTLFTAGMTLLDTTDSVLMVGAYGWAFLNPIRKIWYNLTITAISVVVALLIGGTEALGLIAGKLGLEGAFWHVIGDLNSGLANFGYLVVGIFLVSWAVSYLIYRWQGLDRPLAERAEDRRMTTFRGETVTTKAALPAAPVIYVCITCKRPVEPDSWSRPGAILATATAQAAAGTEVEVRPVRCLANCTRGPSAAMRCNGSWTYVFGGLDATCAEALVEGARLLARAADGILPWRGRPAPLKRGLIARVPPIDFKD